VYNSILCLFVSASYSKICFFTCNYVLQEICHFGSVPEDQETRPRDCLCFIVRFLGTNFAHNFSMVNSSVKI
jgi:hypothetical protein